MSFRIEEKIFLNFDKSYQIMEWIFANGGYKLYPLRSISSIYFDNDNFELFRDSEEGCVPRKKIRIRTYNDTKIESNNNALEVKISSVEGRFKTSQKDVNALSILKMGYFDSSYGLCRPRVLVNYERDYYRVLGARLTIDKKINYSKLDNKFNPINTVHDNNIVAEIKANSDYPLEELNRNFYFGRTRFSKYCRAIHSLRNNGLYSF